MAQKLKTERLNLTLYARSMGKVFKVTALAVGDESANAYMAANDQEGCIACMTVDGVPLVLIAEIRSSPGIKITGDE